MNNVILRYIGRLIISACFTAIVMASFATNAEAQSSFNILLNSDLPGGDYQSISNIGQARCQQACAESPICSAFSYNTDKRKCFLKQARTVPTRSSGAVSGYKTERGAAIAASGGENPTIGGAPMYANKTIVENTANSNDYTTLVAAVRAAGLVETLQGPGPYTVFAPTNEAFDALPAGTVEALLRPENKEQLAKVLNAHVIAGRLDLATLTSDIEKSGGKYKMTTVGGDELFAEMVGKSIYIVDESGDAAEITSADVEQSNGLIHAVSNVLLPASTDPVLDVKASRIFGGPDEYPPTDFAAYGIVAFPAKVSSYDKERHLMMCEAYASVILPAAASPVSRKHQMTTVWPVDTVASARRATKARRKDTCNAAVENYGLATSLKAIRMAKVTGAKVDGRGPFLIAWSPPTSMGQESAVVLFANLSDVADYETATEVMSRWVSDIETNPELWKDGGFDSGVRATVRRWADHYGPMLLTVIGLNGG